MGLVPMTLCDLVRYSNRWSLETLYGEQRSICILIRISDNTMLLVSLWVPVITWMCSLAMGLHSRAKIWPLLTMESQVAQWLEHPTKSQRVVGSNLKSYLWLKFFSEFSLH